MKIRKYPRTHHLEGSRLQSGDEDLASIPFASIRGLHLAIEEKIDGANCGIRFDESGTMHLQSRGHFLTGGGREKHFAMFKQWAYSLAPQLQSRLGSRYAVYGEWLYAKHTIFYDALPHYFLEFDILDLETDAFLATPERRALLEGLPIRSVPVLHEGKAKTLTELIDFVGPSLYKTAAWRDRLTEIAESQGLDSARIHDETDGSDTMEGLYIKVEQEGRVVDRFKWVRGSFLTAVLDSGSHWLSRPIIPNQLAAGADIFEIVP